MEHLDGLVRKSVEDMLNTLLKIKKRIQSATSAGISEVRTDRISGQKHINESF